jgi:hypothetical protein
VRYLISGKVKPERRKELLRALDAGTFGEGFPYGDLGKTLCSGRVDASGTVRWVEVCYCREFYGVAMEEEIPYFEEFLTDLTIVDARSPRGCTGYPDCNDCDCTNKVRPKGEPFADYLRNTVRGDQPPAPAAGRATRWLGWRGECTPEEAGRNRTGAHRVKSEQVTDVS